MRKAALLYNPNSGGTGGKQARRRAEVESAVALLRDAKVDAELALCDSAEEAQRQAQLAVQSGCDTVFACGGDGTIHTVIQELANTQVALAILPMGTANALAHDLRLPMKIKDAAQAALQGSTRRVALGKVDFSDLKGNPGSRFFIVAAGAGVDAHLFYKLHSGTKQRMGMGAYYAKAWQLWFSYAMTRFRAEVHEVGTRKINSSLVTELMAIRIQHFGGVLQELAPGASLDRDDVRVVICSTASRWSYLLYVTRGLLRQTWKVKGIELVSSEKVSCNYADENSSAVKRQKIYLETDGELVGTLPAEITVVRDALTLLAPRR